jgi:DNA invertase Pin-like site-specific DNA recombinase
MKKKAKSMWINIVKVFTESMSAKAPWRFRFNEMVQRIENWEARWIISWKLDRLTRNPVDTGTIQYMLQDNRLDVIVTNDREYFPQDSWLIFSVETWMANQYILDLIKNVRRWLDSKYAKWISNRIKIINLYYNLD